MKRRALAVRCIWLLAGLMLLPFLLGCFDLYGVTKNPHVLYLRGLRNAASWVGASHLAEKFDERQWRVSLDRTLVHVKFRNAEELAAGVEFARRGTEAILTGGGLSWAPTEEDSLVVCFEMQEEAVMNFVIQMEKKGYQVR